MSKYSFTTEEFNEFIADWLNSKNINYPFWVDGAKLFKEYLEEKHVTEEIE